MAGEVTVERIRALEDHLGRPDVDAPQSPLGEEHLDRQLHLGLASADDKALAKFIKSNLNQVLSDRDGDPVYLSAGAWDLSPEQSADGFSEQGFALMGCPQFGDDGANTADSGTLSVLISGASSCGTRPRVLPAMPGRILKPSGCSMMSVTGKVRVVRLASLLISLISAGTGRPGKAVADLEKTRVLRQCSFFKRTGRTSRFRVA